MAKRVAEEQLTREGLLEKANRSRDDRSDSDGDSDDSTGNGRQIKLASSEVMRKRKIAMPKRKVGMGFGTGLTNVFASSSSSSSSTTTTTPGFKPFTHNSNSINFGNNSNSDSNSASSDSDRNARMKALNSQFKDKVNEVVSRDPFCDLTSMLLKYQEYLKSIIASEITIPKKNPVFTTEQKLVSSDRKDKDKSDNDSESDKEIKVEGPKFTISTQPIKSDSVFKFGQKAEEEGEKKKKKKKDNNDSDSDSNSEIEIKGPTFNFTGTVKSDVFKFKPTSKVESKADSDKPQTLNFFGTSSTTAAATTTTTPAVADKIGTTQPTTTAQKPAFSFNFKPSGSSTIASGDSGTTKEEKPPAKFFFGKQSDAAVKIGVTTVPSATTAATTANTSSSSNVTSAPTKSGNSSPFTFSFTSAPAKEDTKSETDKTGDSQSKPMFSFGSVANRVAPTFNFGKPKDSTTAATNAPKNTSVFGSLTERPETPSGGFKFSLPFEQKIPLPPSSGTSAFSTRSNTPLTNITAPEGGDKSGTSGENNAEGDTSTSHQTEPSKQMVLQNGEEDEDSLFSQKAKLMVYNTETKSYTTRGVGEMKVLRKKDDKSKVRLLCRSEGMGNILLNTKILKSFEYKPLIADKENLVKTPFVESDGKLVTLIVKFKLKSDGQDFVKAIENAKQDL